MSDIKKNDQKKVEEDKEVKLTASEMDALRKKDQRNNLKFMRDKDREMVKGMFKFYEVPGGSMSFSLKLYKEDQVENYTMLDGEVYTVPLGVAKHLNKNGWYPVYEHVKGEPGMSSGFDMAGNGMRIGQKVRRFGFQALDFMDSSEFDVQPEKSLVTVERM